MAINKMKMNVRRSTNDVDSVVSFAADQAQIVKPAVKVAWMPGNGKVNQETFLRMAEEHRDAKKKESELEMKCKQLAAQLARTEEAAKRALCNNDATARGGAAQKLLDAERALTKLREENAELRSKLAREKKRCQDLKVAADDAKARLDQALRDQRQLARQVGDMERKLSLNRPRGEDHYWSEEAGRRFVAQQEELVELREQNEHLRAMLQQSGGAPGHHYEGGGVGGGASSGALQESLAAAQAHVSELTSQVAFYEKKFASLVEQHVLGPQEGMPGPAPDDWILEEMFHEDAMYLLDRKTSKIFTVPTANSWPRPVGVRTASKVTLGSNSNMDRFLNTLDNYLKDRHDELQKVFSEFDLDGSGYLDRRELSRLVKRLMPELDSRHIDELGCMLDVDGDGKVSFPELLSTIKEAFTARLAAKTGRSPEVNNALERIRDLIRDEKKKVQEAFSAADTDHDGCLLHMEVVGVMRKLILGLTQKEVRYLLSKLQEWDITGEGKTSWSELLQALELVTIYKVGQGQGGKAVPVHGRFTSPTRDRGNATTTTFTSTVKSTIRQSTAAGLKDGFLRQRVAELEAELAAAQSREEGLEQENGHIDVLRRDLARARARIEDLEKDFSKLDILLRVEEACAGGDTQLQAAWEAAAAFKRRYMEHKAELDSIRLTAARMQAQLDETHKLLHEEHKKRFKLEDDVSRLNMELARIKDLQARLQVERCERVKLEKEYLSLQSTALSAPAAALGEVRGLREELFALRRDKALAEQKEAEVRRELSLVREQLDGMSIEQYKSWQREYHELKKNVTALQLELQAANDKLVVYRRTDNSGVAGIVYGDKEAPCFLSRRPDADKNEDEIRKELAQLREVWHADQLELKKLHHVLETESCQTLEAKAALEEAHREMDRIRRDLQDQMRTLQRELDRRDERIRKLELQLRGAYSGINRALRSSRLRDSRATDCPDDMSEIGDDQNLLELHISEATLYEEALGRDPSTFFTFDFFMHDTQATPVLSSNAPVYDTLVQYVVDADTFLVQYLDNHVMELELNRARGWDYDSIGVARIQLRQILEDVEIGAALGHNRAYHYADIHGADGRRIGRVRFGFSFRKPLDTLIKDYRIAARNRKASDIDARDPAAAAVHVAATKPSQASHVKVVVARCEGLVAPSGAGSATRPYVWFRFPGHREPYSTRMMHGLGPVYNDESAWLLARTPELEQEFKTREMEFVVFDEAGGEDPLRGIIGIAFVPLSGLSAGMPVEGAFKLINPITKQPAGRIVLGLGWHNPLRLPGSKADKPRSNPASAREAFDVPPGAQHAQQQAVGISPAVMYGAEAAGLRDSSGAGQRAGAAALPPFASRGNTASGPVPDTYQQQKQQSPYGLESDVLREVPNSQAVQPSHLHHDVRQQQQGPLAAVGGGGSSRVSSPLYEMPSFVPPRIPSDHLAFPPTGLPNQPAGIIPSQYAPPPPSVPGQSQYGQQAAQGGMQYTAPQQQQGSRPGGYYQGQQPAAAAAAPGRQPAAAAVVAYGLSEEVEPAPPSPQQQQQSQPQPTGFQQQQFGLGYEVRPTVQYGLMQDLSPQPATAGVPLHRPAASQSPIVPQRGQPLPEAASYGAVPYAAQQPSGGSMLFSQHSGQQGGMGFAGGYPAQRSRYATDVDRSPSPQPFH